MQQCPDLWIALNKPIAEMWLSRGRGKPLAAAAAALALTCSPAVAGCAPGGAAVDRAAPAATASRDATVALIAAAARTTLADTAGVEFELRGARAFGPSTAPVLGSGQFDFALASGSEQIDLGETGSLEPGNERAVFLSERVYLQPKGVGSSVLPKGKEWVSATLSGSDTIATNFPSFVLQVEGVDPQLLLAELAGGTVAATPIGGSVVGGEPARGYVATVDLARALDALSGPGAEVLGRAIQTELANPGVGASAHAGQSTIVVSVDWQGHVVQMRSAPPGAGVGTATMSLCCFGEPVRVSAPANARVVDLAALAPSGERENNGGGDSDGG
jgi:hypothetical protein